MAEKRSGMSLPTGIFAATTPPPEVDPEPIGNDEAGQGGSSPVAAQVEDSSAEPKATRTRKKKAMAATGPDTSDDGAKLYLSADVRFRLRMLAYTKGQKISTVANEVLDKALPRWDLRRTD